MKIRPIRKESVFIPEFNSNKELETNQQIRVHIKSFPTVAESKGYKSYRHTEGGGIEIVYPNDVSMLIRHIGKIENLDIEDNDNIIDGKTLSSTKILELSPLFSEIRDYLLEATEPIEEKED